MRNTFGAAAFAAGALFLGISTTFAIGTVVVSPQHMNGWLLQYDGTASGTFVNGPGVPPAGTGSFHMGVGSDGDSAIQIRTRDFDGMQLAQLTDFTYATYVEQNNVGQAPYAIINVDQDGDGAADDRLFFEPVYQNGTYSTKSGAVIPNQCGADPNCVAIGQWQTWDVRNGGLWAVNDGDFGPPLVSFDNYVLQHPTATVATSASGSIRVVAGGGAGAWDNFLGAMDNVKIGFVTDPTTTYDFELDGGNGTSDLGITKTGSGVVTAGGNALYNLSIQNAGPDSASGVTVTDVAPAGTTYVPALSDPSCTATGGVVTCSNLQMGSGATRTLALAFAVPANYACPSLLVNTATVSGSGLDLNPLNDSSTSTRTVNCAASDLGIVKSGSGVVNRGGNAVYTLQATNYAPTAASGVTVRDVVPAGVTYAPAQSDAACTQSGGVVTCPNLQMGSGATRTLVLAFAVPATYDCGTPLVNTATISGSTLSGSTMDPNPSNNSSTSTRTVNCLPGDIGIKKTSSGTLSLGGSAVYNLLVSNFGTTSESGVTVRDVVPAGVTYVPARSDAACTQSGGVVTCPNLAMGSGSTRSLVLTFAIPATYDCNLPLSNTATVTGSTLDTNPSNDSSTTTGTIACPQASSSSSSSAPVATNSTGGGGGGGGGGGRRPPVSSTGNVPPPATGGPDGNNTFSDVVRGSFYEDAVNLFLERGFLDASQTRFRPNDVSTRAELTKLVIELHGGILSSPSGSPSFDDVRPGTWYYDYMEDAGERTWVRGDNNCYGRHPCTARPNDGIIRAEAAAIIVRTFDFEATGDAPRFSDVPNGSWYSNWVQAAADHCVLQGDAGRATVRPLERVTRAEIIVMLSRAYDDLSYADGCRQVGTRDRITSVSLTSPDTLEVRFNADIDNSSAMDEDMFVLTCNGQRSIASSRAVGARVVELTLDNALPAGRSCRVSVMGLENGDGMTFNDSLAFVSRAPTSSSSSSRSSSRSSSSSTSSTSRTSSSSSSMSSTSSSMSSSSSSSSL